jgi:hypothetical protein
MAAARYSIERLVTVAAIVAAAAGDAVAGTSSLGAHVTTSIAHTDNIALAEDGQSAFIGDVSTGINFERVQERIDTQVGYTVQGIFYDEFSESDRVFHQVDSRAHVTIAPNRFFLDAFGVLDQTVADPTGKYSFNNYTITSNRADVAIYGLAPSLSLDFGTNIGGAVSYSAAKVDYDDSSLEDSMEYLSTVTLGNKVVRSGLTWQATYTGERFDYPTPPEIEFQTFTMDLGYWVAPTIRLFTVQGLESDYSSVLGASGDSPGLDEHFWTVGVAWQPSERAGISLSAGERSFGHSRGLEASYRTRRGSWQISYGEQPASFARDVVRGARQAGEVVAIGPVQGPQGNTYFLQKTVRSSFVLERSKSAIGMGYFKEERFDILAAANHIKNLTESYDGAEWWMSWEMSPVWTMNASAQRSSRASQLNQVDDRFTYASLSFQRRLGMRTMFWTSFSRESSKPISGVLNRYSENQWSAGIQRTFGASADSVPTRFSGASDAKRQGF